MSDLFRRREDCRICGGRELAPVVDLGAMPLANRLRRPDDAAPEPRLPLAVVRCEACSNAQLTVVVRPEAMFSEYAYRSGISDTFVRHCGTFAREAEAVAGLAPGSAVLDIGGNDGTLLSAFRARGHRTRLVDPAANLASTAKEGGHEVLTAFWGRSASADAARRWGKTDLVTATNVVAHVDDLDDFFAGVAEILAPAGRLAIEVPYLADLVEKSEFDTIYHEHISYFLLRPLLRLGEKHGLGVAYVRRIPVHGGGLRVYFGRGVAQGDTVRSTLAYEEEAGLWGPVPYRRFAREIESIRSELRAALLRLRSEGKKVAAFGASAKGAILLNAAGVDPTLVSFIVDDTPEKQGRIAPGTGIPIVSMERLAKDPPELLLLLAWNFVDEILEKTRDYARAGGRYIVPVPSLRFL